MKSLKVQVAISMEAQDLLAIDQQAASEDIPRSVWIRREIRKALAAARSGSGVKCGLYLQSLDASLENL